MISQQSDLASTTTHCPHCSQAVRIIPSQSQPREDQAVNIVSQDGSVRAATPQRQLRLVEPDAPEAKWTLRQWWTDAVRPAMIAERKSAARLGDYETYLRRWDQWAANHRIDTPVVCDISPATLTQFRTWLLSEQKLNAAQADKHLQGVSTLLKRAVDAWIIPRLARLPACGRKGEAVKFVFSSEDLDQLYKACDGVQWPSAFQDGRPCSAAPYWRAYIVGGWNYGFRPQEWWSYEKRATSLLWSGVLWPEETEVEGRMVRSEHGWLTWRQDKTDHVMMLPMNAAVRDHLEALWSELPKRSRRLDRRVWDFPYSAGTAKPSQLVTPASGWYAAWWDLVERAGLRPKLAEDSRGNRRALTHCPSHFRKTAHTLHRDRIGNAANWITGHSGRTIGERHYYNAIAKVVESITTLPQPAAFGS